MKNCEFNEELCHQLIFISEYYNKKDQRIPYGIAYMKAVKALRDFSNKVKRRIKQDDYTTLKGKHKTKIPGIGKGISKKITQYLNSGIINDYTLAKNDKLLDKKIQQGKINRKNSDDTSIDLLSSISYIGKKTATILVKKYGFKTIESLKDAVKNSDETSNGTISILAPNGEKTKLNKNQQKMLKYHYYLKRLPREFIKILEETMKYLLEKTYGNNGYSVVFAGSYRRGANNSGDIDIIVKSTKFTLKQFIDLLKKWGVIFDTLSHGSSDFKGLGRCPGMKDFIFRIDILFATKENWIPALVHFTGNDILNRIMREKANNMKKSSSGKKLKYGAILSQNGLFERDSNGNSTGTRLRQTRFTSEKQLFSEIGMIFLKPSERN